MIHFINIFLIGTYFMLFNQVSDQSNFVKQHYLNMIYTNYYSAINEHTSSDLFDP